MPSRKKERETSSRISAGERRKRKKKIRQMGSWLCDHLSLDTEKSINSYGWIAVGLRLLSMSNHSPGDVNF